MDREFKREEEKGIKQTKHDEVLLRADSDVPCFERYFHVLIECVVALAVDFQCVCDGEGTGWLQVNAAIVLFLLPEPTEKCMTYSTEA